MHSTSSSAHRSPDCAPHHAALLTDFDTRADTAAQFLKPAAVSGADCIIVARQCDFNAWKQGMAEHGLLVGPRDEIAPIMLVSPREWLPARDLDSLRMSARLWDRIQASRAASMQLHIVIDMAWAVEAGIPSGKICHWEATTDNLLEPEQDVSVLCLYDMSVLPPDLLHAALRTHSQINVQGHTIPNRYFEAPAILEMEPYLNHCSADTAAVRELLTHLQRVV